MVALAIPQRYSIMLILIGAIFAKAEGPVDMVTFTAPQTGEYDIGDLRLGREYMVTGATVVRRGADLSAGEQWLRLEVPAGGNVAIELSCEGPGPPAHVRLIP